jgi:hypothetical protein
VKAKLLRTTSLRHDTKLVAGDIVTVASPDDIPGSIKEVMDFYASMTTEYVLVAIHEDGVGSPLQLVPDFHLELLPIGEEV